MLTSGDDFGKRDWLELWVDRHNHKLELIRTITSFLAAAVGILVALKVFRLI